MIYETLTNVNSNSKVCESSVDIEREKIRTHMNIILDNIQTTSEIEALKKLIAPIEPTLLAVTQQNKSFHENKQSNKVPANKKVTPQRRLYSTKKSKKRRIKLKKPLNEEANAIALRLLNQKNYN